MEFDSANSDSTARLRLVDVRLGAGETSLHFGGGLAGVYTASSDRQRRRASDRGHGHRSVRPADAAGSVDINGRVISVHSLPPLPLPPSAPAVLDRDDLERALASAVCTPPRGARGYARVASPRTSSHLRRARSGTRP